MKINVLKLFNRIWKKIFICFVAILIIIISPLLFFVLSPIFFFRILVSHLSKIMRPDLGKMLNALSCIFASDDITINPKFTFVGYYSIKGPVDIEMLKSRLTEKVIGVRKVGNDLKNIELKQYPYKWMGFFFWKLDENFDISNHVKYYEDKTNQDESKISIERVDEVTQKLMFEPHPERRSPWDLTIFQNVQSDNEEEETILLFRFHHSIADALALAKMIWFEIMDEAPKQVLHKFASPKLSVFQRLLNYLKFAKLPYEAAEVLVESCGHNDWKIKENKKSNKHFEVTARNIPLSFIKGLSKDFNTSVNSLLLSAVTAGFRYSMLKQNGKVPNHIHMGLPIPRENHPDKLRNFCTGFLVKLPIGEEDSLKRLNKIEQSLKRMKTSNIPLGALIVSTCIGCLFHWMIRRIATMVLFSSMTAVGSIFPGPKGKLTIFGQEHNKMYGSAIPQFGNYGINFGCLSCRDLINMNFVVNENILASKAELEEMVSIILKELQILKQCSSKANEQEQIEITCL